MLSKHKKLAAFIVLGVLTAITAAHGQLAVQPSDDPIMKSVPEHLVAIRRGAVAPDDRYVVVNGFVMPRIDERPFMLSAKTPDELSAKAIILHGKMAKILSDFEGIPDDRIEFFSSLRTQPNLSIHRWGGVVETVDPTSGGYVVTVKVMPVVHQNGSSRTVILTPHAYYEQFLVGKNGSCQFLGSLDPEGKAGQRIEPMAIL